MAYNPTVGLCRLYKCTSKNGNEYFRGRMGFANVVLLKSDQVSDNGQEIWYLKVSEPEQRDADQRPQPRSAAVAEADQRAAANGFKRDELNDAIPF